MTVSVAPRFAALLVLAGLILALFPARAQAATFVADTTADDPGLTMQGCDGATANDCSLRGAITRANLSSEADVITFGVAGTITLASGLPLITGGGDTIDATGADITIDGNGIDETQNFVCFIVVSSGNTIKGLKITDCAAAILIQTGGNNNTIGPDNVLFDNGSAIGIIGDGNIVIGNKIGTNSNGTAVHADGANLDGVGISGDDNTVGGTGPADRNIISGNSLRGIHLDTSAAGNAVYGNYIGTDITGTADLGNLRGMEVQGSGNLIGGTNPGEGNLISGNSSFNVRMFQEAADGNVVAGNIIGPDVSGVGTAMSAPNDNVLISGGGDDNVVGPGNVVSNGGFGVKIENTGTTGNIVKGNKIGTNPAGTAPVPNSASGVAIFGGAGGNTVGDTASGDGNIIAFNGFNGVIVSDNGVNNRIRANSIHDNADIEINNLSGGNFETAPPLITAAGSNAVGGTTCASCEVDVFSDGVADAEFFEGFVTADAGGQWVLYTSVAGPMVTATKTDSAGNTSELSIAVGFTAPDGDADGVPNTLDNCPVDSNANQTDTDGDGAGDACDGDDDDDSLPDGSDSCPALAEDFDGFEDTDGCPEPDNDSDGICDQGLTSVSCIGSDFGRMLWQNPLPAQQDCRNVPEDFDAFHDDDGCPEPDNDYDGFPDVTDDCPATDFTAGPDGIADTGDEPLNQNNVPIKTREDFDGIIDTDGCHDSPEDDYDGDSRGILQGGLPLFRDEREALVLGTDPVHACAATPTANDEASPDAWPPDFNDNQSVSITDVLFFKGQLNTTNGRFDFDGSGGVSITDVLFMKFYFNQSCTA